MCHGHPLSMNKCGSSPDRIRAYNEMFSEDILESSR